MNIFTRWRLFQKAATGILVVFIGLMLLVVIVAHSRPSGSTRQDMAKAQLLRKNAAVAAKNTEPINNQ